MIGGWYTSGSAREGAGGGGGGDGSGVGVAGASGAGGGAGVGAGTPAPAERTAAAPVSAPNDATMIERIMACIPPNSRRVGYIYTIHEPLDGPLYMGSHIHQHT